MYLFEGCLTGGICWFFQPIQKKKKKNHGTGIIFNYSSVWQFPPNVFEIQN